MTREAHIDKYFLNLELNRENIDIYYVRKSILAFLRQNIQQCNGILLDVGCGIMPYRETILSENKAIVQYIGLDFENSLDLEYQLGKPDLFWTGKKIPLADRSVNTIIATEFFEHVPDPENIMLEMIRVLQPGGVLLFTVPFLWNLHLVPYDEYRYTPFSIERLLVKSGFDRINLTPLGGWDASLAQMMGIWLQRRPMSIAKRKLLSRIILPVMKKLISMEGIFTKNDLFKDGGMITGIGGVAYTK